MKIVDDKITVKELKKMSEKMFDNLVKAVVDIEKEVMVVDAMMHADQESLLLDKGSKQESLWGINLYPNKTEEQDFIEFDSMINIKPRQDNRGRGIYNPKIREKITKIVNKLVKK